jgi:hypothetical protein
MEKPIIILEHSLYKRSAPSIKGLGAPVRMVILPRKRTAMLPKIYYTSLGTRSILRKISEELILKQSPERLNFRALFYAIIKVTSFNLMEHHVQRKLLFCQNSFIK